MSTLKLLGYDPRMLDPANKVYNEQHTLVLAPSSPLRVFVLDHGRFFAKTLVVRDAAGRTLLKGADKDYVATYFYQEQSKEAGQLVAGVVTIVNPAVVGPVRCDYHAMGGEYPLFNQAIRDILATIRLGGGYIDWNNVLHKPSEFAASRHEHDWWQSYAMDDLVSQLQRGAAAIRTGQAPFIRDIITEAQGRPAILASQLAQHNQAILNHRYDGANPHKTTKAHINLGSIVNVPMATYEEMLNYPNLSELRYVHPFGFKAVLDDYAVTKLTAHRNDYANPHGMTAAHFDAYTKPQFDNRFNTKQDRYARVPNSALFATRTYAQTMVEVKSNIPASRVVSGMFDPARIGNGGSNFGTVLDGTGTWRSLPVIFEQYERKSTKAVFVTGFGAESNIIPYLQLNFSDMTVYPIGTIAYYNYVYGSDARPFSQVRAAVKLGNNLWIN